jgi:hypothetical protein
MIMAVFLDIPDFTVSAEVAATWRPPQSLLAANRSSV